MNEDTLTGHVTLIGILTGLTAGVNDELSPDNDDDDVRLLSAAETCRKSIESPPSTSVTSRPNVHGWVGVMSDV